MAVLDAGNSRNNAFCQAFFQLRLGKVCSAAARDVIERSASDRLGDASFKVGCELIFDQEGKLEEEPFGGRNEFGESVEKAVGKIGGALASWSSMRTEEQWPEVSNIMDELYSLVESRYAAALRILVFRTINGIKTANRVGEAWQASSWSAEGRASSDAIAAYTDAAMSVVNTEADVRRIVCDAERCGMALLRLATVVQEVGKVEPTMKEELLSACQRDLSSLSQLGLAMTMHIQAVSQCQRILSAQPASLEPWFLLQEYEEWLATKEGVSDDMQEESIVPHSLASAAISMPFLGLGAALVDAINATRKCVEEFDFKVMLESVSDMPTVDDIMVALRFLIAGPFAAAWREVVWDSIVERCVEHLIETSRIMGTNCIDRVATERGVDQHFLALLIRSDLGNLEKEAAEHINFNDCLAKLMPHARAAATLKHIMLKTARATEENGYKFRCLQHSIETATPVPLLLCSELVLLAAQMKTVMVIAAVANRKIFDGAEGLFISPEFVVSPKGKQLAQSPGPCAEPLSMIQNLASAVGALSGMLAKDIFVDVDSGGYNLMKPLAHCRQWCSDINSFLQGLRLQWAREGARMLRSRANSLEEAVPRWSTIIGDDQLDHVLVKARLLDNPKRHLVRPTITFLSSTMKKITEMEQNWEVGPGSSVLDASLRNYAECASKTGGHYLVIVAACNTLINFGSCARSSSMADEVLGLIKKRQADPSGFVCPPLLLRLLQALAAGGSDSAEARSKPRTGNLDGRSEQASASGRHRDATASAGGQSPGKSDEQSDASARASGGQGASSALVPNGSVDERGSGPDQRPAAPAQGRRGRGRGSRGGLRGLANKRPGTT